MPQTPDAVVRELCRLWAVAERDVSHLLTLNGVLATHPDSPAIHEQRQLIVHEIDRRYAQARQKMQEVLNAYRPDA
jgi:hypothetical protein